MHFAVVYFVDKRRAEATIGTVARTLVRTVELYPQGAQGKAWEAINSDNVLFLGDLVPPTATTSLGGLFALQL